MEGCPRFETDPLGRVTTFTYDGVNRMTGTTYPDGTTKSWTYDYRGNKLTETDQLGRVTKWVYDLAGQLTSMTAAFGTAEAGTTSYTYDLAGRKLTETDPRGNVTLFGYDAAGRMTSVRDGALNVTTYGYDAKGQRTSMVDAKSRTTSYTYDSRGRQLVTTLPGGATTSKAYDGLGLVISSTDEEGRVTQYGYDAASQLTSVTDALNQVTRYAYDLSGNKVSQTDASNRVTTYVYDKLNRRTSRTLPLAQVETMAYDFVGNLTSKVDFNGKTTTYAYDSLNRLLTKTPDASFTGAAAIVMTYNATGQRASMVDAAGTTNYTYDSRNRLKTKATPQGTLTYSYDAASNVTGVVSSNANGTDVQYTYDANNRLASVVDNRTSGTTTYSYDATNQVASIAYPNGVGHVNTYDNRDRLTNVAVNGPAGVLATYGQTFSPTSHKTSVTENSGRAVNYTYDSIYRLLNESITGNANAALNGALSYGLDAVGNRLSLTSTLAAIAGQTNAFDANDRLVADTYDANGNTLSSGGNTFGYEFEDRLTSYNGGAIGYVYDGDGNRVVRTAGGSTTRFLIDDLTPTGYAQVAEEVVAGFVVRQYTHGLMRVSQRQNVSGTWTTSYYGYDGFGSTRQLLSAAGVVTDTYAYDGFGNVVAQSGTTPNQYLYRGEALDAGTGMYYLRARWYRPGVGRFLTRDKFEGPEPKICACIAPGAAGKGSKSTIARGHHLFAYGDGDPVNRIDPSGNNSIEWSIISSLLNGPGVKAVIDGVIAYCGSIALVKMQLLLLETITGDKYSAEFGKLEFPCDASDVITLLLLRGHR
jgi:RHS repeat-associated protein